MQGDLEQIEIRHQCGQDGEMGHETRNARAHDTSQINGERYPTLTFPTIGPWPNFNPLVPRCDGVWIGHKL